MLEDCSPCSGTKTVRNLCVLSTVCLLIVLLSPLLLLLWDASGEKEGLLEVVWALALGEESAKNTLLRGVSEQIIKSKLFSHVPSMNRRYLLL